MPDADLYFIELPNRVLSVRATPNTPGYRRRKVLIRVESGPALTLLEYRRMRALVIDCLEQRGCVVRRVRGRRE